MFRGTKPASLHVPPSSSSQRYVKKETNQLSPVKKRIKERFINEWHATFSKTYPLTFLNLKCLFFTQDG